MLDLSFDLASTGQVSPDSRKLDEDGFLVDWRNWDKDFSQRRADLMQINLDDRHWKLINFIRDRFTRLGAIPPMRRVCRSSEINRQELKQQFGSCLNVWKLAGLPNPGEEAKTYMN
ncbi:MAG: TusE/DsrC/DsvC family sulfur relay protein [Gammaproteobacteria bacterium]|jgi:tRNA 2-thiouridine synthesizing protein E